MSGEESFRFLSLEVFSRLDLKSKAVYLVRAQEAVESCTQMLREQRDDFMKALTSYPGRST
jgi:hypothetical protein